jgi:hypothetical protein
LREQRAVIEAPAESVVSGVLGAKKRGFISRRDQRCSALFGESQNGDGGAPELQISSRISTQ